MADLDRLLHPDVADAAADAARVPSFEDVERRGDRRRRRAAALAVGAATAALAVTALLGRQWLPGPDEAAPLPPAGRTPTPAATARPSPEGVVRAVVESGPEGMQAWGDAADVPVGEVDIRRVEVGSFGGVTGPDWLMELGSGYPGEAALDARGRVVEYGLVIDSDADLVGDCEIGISNDNDTTTQMGDFRVWVTNLRTGEKAEKVGPSYGIPIDFRHPGETDAPGLPQGPPQMRFFFVTRQPGPCDGYGDVDHLSFWAELREDDRVVARDVAPDTGWLRVE